MHPKLLSGLKSRTLGSSMILSKKDLQEKDPKNGYSSLSY